MMVFSLAIRCISPDAGAGEHQRGRAAAAGPPPAGGPGRACASCPRMGCGHARPLRYLSCRRRSLANILSEPAATATHPGGAASTRRSCRRRRCWRTTRSSLPTVEINNTLLPDARARDAAQVGGRDAHRRSASRSRAHAGSRTSKRLGDAGEAIAWLFKAAGELGDKLGPVLFQLPPNVKKDVAVLDAFLGELPASRAAGAGVPPRVLVRDRGLRACCASAAPRCASPRPRTWRRRSRRRPPWGYLRLRRQDYDDAAVAAWARADSRAGLDRGLRLLQARGRGQGPQARRPAVRLVWEPRQGSETLLRAESPHNQATVEFLAASPTRGYNHLHGARNRRRNDLVWLGLDPGEALLGDAERRRESRSICCTPSASRGSSSSTSARTTTRSSGATRWSRATSSPRTSTSSSRTEELKALEEKATQTIDIAEFVPLRSDRSGLLRQGLLPRPREGRREGVPAAVRGDARDRTRGPGALRGARQAVPGAAAPEHRGRAGHAAAALRRRGPPVLRGARCPTTSEVKEPELQPGQAAHRSDRRRDLRTDQVPRRREGAHRGGHPAQGRGPGDRGHRARAGAGAHHRPDGGAEGEPGQEQGRAPAAAESASAAEAADAATDRKPARRSDEAKAEPKKKAAKR